MHSASHFGGSEYITIVVALIGVAAILAGIFGKRPRAADAVAPRESPQKNSHWPTRLLLILASILIGAGIKMLLGAR